MARKPKSGVKSATDPQREGFTDIRAKLLHGHRDWKMIRLRELITACRHYAEQTQKASTNGGWTASDERLVQNHLETRAEEINALWREACTAFEQAVLDGDADWFERQAKAIRSGDRRSDTKARGRFEAAVARELELAFWKARAERPLSEILPQTAVPDALRKAAATGKGRAKQATKQRRLAAILGKDCVQVEKIDLRTGQPHFWLRKKNPDVEDATLEPAGKRAGITAQQILDKLDQRKDGRYLMVEGCRFSDARRAREAITRIAELHGWHLPI